MGKNLKFPTRGKFVPEVKEKEMPAQEISEEEHEKRLKLLKDLGLIK